MLVASTLASILEQSVKGKGAYVSMQAWCDALSQYILQNAELTFQWTGKLPYPPFTPDPMVNPKGKFVSLSIPPMKCYKITDMGIMVQKGCMAGKINITGFQTIPVPFGVTTPLITSYSYGSTPYETQLHIANQIVNWIKGWVVPTPLAPAHGSFVGVGMHILTR